MSQKLLPGGVPSAGYGSINNNALILDIVNWTTHYSVEASRVYWYNRVTGVTTYDRPECLSTPVGLILFVLPNFLTSRFFIVFFYE